MCLACGIDDPIAWLDQIEKSVLDVWEAYYRVEPWGFEWQRTAILCEVVEELREAIYATHGAQLEKPDWRKFMPANYVGLDDKKPSASQTPEQMVALLNNVFKAK